MVRHNIGILVLTAAGLVCTAMGQDKVIFDFESGDLQGWKVVEGKFNYLVSDRPTFHNKPNEKSLLASSSNVPGTINRHRHQLENDSHPNKELQSDWNELGPYAFDFETLDLLKPSDEPDSDPSDDLRVLKELWVDKLTATGASLY